jgi:molybdate transport system ATP-binding protein
MSLLSFQCRHRYPGGFQLDAAFALDHPVTSLFGPSGSGKTSVLSAIAGFLRPQSGKVRLGERILLDTAGRVCLPPEQRHVGVVFQDHLLFPHLTVEANLLYGQRRRTRRRWAGMAAAHTPHRAAPRRRSIELSRVVEVLEIGGLLRRYPARLSGGEQQRVALGRALLCGPELLLMDEPLASLDARLKARILAYLQRVVAEWKIPTLFVSHSQADVRRVADWVVVLKDGRVVTGATPDEALSQPEPLGWKNATGPVNLLRLEQVQFGEDHATGRIGDQLLYLPPLDRPVVGGYGVCTYPPPRGGSSGGPADGRAALPMFVEFSPTDVTLSRHDVAGVSARNHLQGRVCQVVPLRQAVFVAVDIGQVLWAEVTPEAAAELELKPGSQVICLLKAHSLRVVD